MTRTRKSKAFSWFVAILFVGSALPAAAQTPAPQLSAGVQLLHVPDSWFTGINADVAFPRANGWAVVVEGGWAHQAATPPFTGKIDVYNVGAGPRWSTRMDRVTPFVQVLGGVEFTDEDRAVPGAALNDSDQAAMLQPGLGVFVAVGRMWGVVVQGDARYVFFKEGVDTQYRFVFGVRLASR